MKKLDKLKVETLKEANNTSHLCWFGYRFVNFYQIVQFTQNLPT